jgi:hypothetical protein
MSRTSHLPSVPAEDSYRSSNDALAQNSKLQSAPLFPRATAPTRTTPRPGLHHGAPRPDSGMGSSHCEFLPSNYGISSWSVSFRLSANRLEKRLPCSNFQ